MTLLRHDQEMIQMHLYLEIVWIFSATIYSDFLTFKTQMQLEKPGYVILGFQTK